MTQAPRTKQRPPAAPYASFKAALRTFKEHGAPAPVDTSALRRRFPANVSTQLLETLSFFGLVDRDSAPTERMAELVAAIDDAEWAQALRDTLEQGYHGALLDDLEKTTPAQLNQQLKTKYGVTGAACRRTVAFLLSAAQDAQMEVSPYLLAGARGRLPAPSPTNGAAHDGAHADPDELTAKLIEKFPEFDPKWSESLKEYWFTQFSELVQLVKPGDRSS